MAATRSVLTLTFEDEHGGVPGALGVARRSGIDLHRENKGTRYGEVTPADCAVTMVTVCTTWCYVTNVCMLPS
jgi:hypothetical protein